MKRSPELVAVATVSIVFGAVTLAALPSLMLYGLEHPFVRVRTLVYLVLAVLLIGSGLGALRLRSWAAILVKIYAVGQMAMGTLTIAQGIGALLNEGAASQPGFRPLLGAGLVVTFLGQVAWPVVLLVFYSRPGLKAQLGLVDGGAVSPN